MRVRKGREMLSHDMHSYTEISEFKKAASFCFYLELAIKPVITDNTPIAPIFSFALIYLQGEKRHSKSKLYFLGWF